MAQYRVEFSNGSKDIVEADSAGEAREIASKEYGRVRTVEIIEPDAYDEEDDLEDDEDEAEDDEEDEEGGDEDDDGPVTRKRK